MTNRQRLQRVLRDLERLRTDPAISPTPYEHLTAALVNVEQACQFVLDTDERDGVRHA